MSKKETSLTRINIENALKLIIIIGFILYIYSDLKNALQIMFQNNLDKAGDLLLAINTLVIGSMFAYFSFSYVVVQKNSIISRILVYLKTVGLLTSILLTLTISAILFPLYLGGLEWLFYFLSLSLGISCIIYDILNTQVMGKDW